MLKNVCAEPGGVGEPNLSACWHIRPSLSRLASFATQCSGTKQTGAGQHSAMAPCAPLLALFLLASWGLTGAHGTIVNSHIVFDDRQLIPLTEGFGFADPVEGVRNSGGQFHMELRNLTVHPGKNASSSTNLDRMAIFLSGLEPEALLDSLSTGGCVLDIANVSTAEKNLVIRFSDTQIKRLLDTGSPVSLSMTEGIHGMGYIYFGSCDPAFTPVSFDMRIEMYNVDGNGNRSYLSVGDAQLGVIYWVMFSFFTLTTIAWFGLVWKDRAYSQRIHYLMGVLGIFKALTLMSQAISIHFVALTGSADGWNVAYYIFTFCRGVLFFTIIVLIGTGWSYMKPFLGDREKRVLMLIIPLQVFANIAIIVTAEESPSERDWFTWHAAFSLIDIICCCAILFPIVWSIKSLKDASATDGKAARSLEKLTLFRQFYVMVVVYIYFTRIVVYLLHSTLPFQYTWVSVAADELATLAFYVWVAVSFRPLEANPYFRLPQVEGEVELK